MTSFVFRFFILFIAYFGLYFVLGYAKWNWNFLQQSFTHIKAEMDKTLKWLVPFAANTVKWDMQMFVWFLSTLSNLKKNSTLAGLLFVDENRLEVPAISCSCVFLLFVNIVDRLHQGFGWVGEWANTRLVINTNFSWVTVLTRIVWINN